MAEPRHKKMYKDSPKLERKEDGKMGVSKAEKKSAETSSGTEGAPEHDQAVMKLHQKHAKERMEMHHKHEKEHMALMHKGMGKAGTEGSPEEEQSESKAEAAKEGD